METKMLRWTAGVTPMDHIRNGAIRQKFGVAPIADKMHESCLRWYVNVLREKEDSVRKIGLELEVSGKRPRGRPKQRCSDMLHTDMMLVSTLIKRRIGKGGVVTPEERTPRRGGTSAEEKEEEETGVCKLVRKSLKDDLREHHLTAKSRLNWSASYWTT
ncbi:unnamed protein product [Heligmosomoides polygyrus]|uniref:HTH_48 domain-containing protein n=1 Tax=Heligmosomoides polygyrus TaxID=6339 RepID=A0A183FWV1_HELPZ|nr:unnamed protein product [Heligmosomoides polygyrus]